MSTDARQRGMHDAERLKSLEIYLVFILLNRRFMPLLELFIIERQSNDDFFHERNFGGGSVLVPKTESAK